MRGCKLSSEAAEVAIAGTAKRKRGRPPKLVTGCSETRTVLVRAGVAILTQKGFSATGLDEILRSVNVPKGSFYHYFESKDAFGAELIDAYNAYFVDKLDHFLLNKSREPIDRLRDFVCDAEAGMKRYGYSRGCLVGNMGQEMGSLSEAFRQQITGVFSDWQERTARCLREARARGDIPDDVNCARAAELFWIGWEGAVLRAKLEKSARPLRIFSEAFFRMLER